MSVKLGIILILGCSTSYAINKRGDICKKICISVNSCTHMQNNIFIDHVAPLDYSKCELKCEKSVITEPKLPIRKKKFNRVSASDILTKMEDRLIAVENIFKTMKNIDRQMYPQNQFINDIRSGKDSDINYIGISLIDDSIKPNTNFLIKNKFTADNEFSILSEILQTNADQLNRDQQLLSGAFFNPFKLSGNLPDNIFESSVLPLVNNEDNNFLKENFPIRIPKDLNEYFQIESEFPKSIETNDELVIHITHLKDGAIAGRHCIIDINSIKNYINPNPINDYDGIETELKDNTIDNSFLKRIRRGLKRPINHLRSGSAPYITEYSRSNAISGGSAGGVFGGGGRNSMVAGFSTEMRPDGIDTRTYGESQGPRVQGYSSVFGFDNIENGVESNFMPPQSFMGSTGVSDSRRPYRPISEMGTGYQGRRYNRIRTNSNMKNGMDKYNSRYFHEP